jgi:hypothetical protein
MARRCERVSLVGDAGRPPGRLRMGRALRGTVCPAMDGLTRTRAAEVIMQSRA